MKKPIIIISPMPNLSAISNFDYRSAVGIELDALDEGTDDMQHYHSPTWFQSCYRVYHNI
jgi:hypothetical protein